MTTLSSTDAEQRARLNQAKLRAIVRGLLRAPLGAGAANPEPAENLELEDRALGGVAALVVPPSLGREQRATGYVLAAGQAGIGAALVWARRQPEPLQLAIIAEGDSAGILARRARYFVEEPIVYLLTGTDVSVADPAAHLPVMVADPAALAAVAPLRAAGVDVVVEHGVVTAELSGLEVARVMPDAEGDGFHLEVGVGRYDREAARLMQAVRSTEEVTRTVIQVVRDHRRPGETPHLLNRLARQRWLRSMLLADPALVGATALQPIEPPAPRENLIEPVPAMAAGTALDGHPVVVACCVGVDPEAMPTAADVRDRTNPEAELIYVSPARDQYRAVRELAEALHRPARMVALDGQWAD
ncbi:MAG: hypothetical protein ACKV2O_15045 [Acidimicrobiales bacterium]